MSHGRLAFSQVRLIAKVTWIEALRHRLLHGMFFLGLALALGAQFLRDINFGSPGDQFLLGLGLGVLGLLGSIVSIVLVAQLFAGELENRTALALLAKRVARATFIAGKFLGIVAVIALFACCMTVVLALVLWQQAGFTLGTGRELVAGAWLQGMKFMVLAACTLVFASYAKGQFFPVVMGLAVLVIGHLHPLAQVALQQSPSIVIQGLAGLIALTFPNFHVFDLGYGESVVLSGQLLARITLYALGYLAVLGGLAILGFRKREL